MRKHLVSPTIVLILIAGVFSGCLAADNSEEEPTWPLSSSFTIAHTDSTSTYATANANPAGGKEPYQYQWKLDGVLQSGTSSNILFNDLSVGTHSIELNVMDAAGSFSTSTQSLIVEASQVWVPDWKINVEFKSFTPRGIDMNSSDDITMEFYWDDANTGEFEAGELCSTWDRSDGDDVVITLNKKCVIDVSDESHQVGYTACAYVDDGSPSPEKIDIYDNDDTYASCLLSKDVNLDENGYRTKTYDGLNDNDGEDLYYHGKLVVYWEWFDDGEYVTE